MKAHLNKIKDWLIITRIRLLNFIKEHKYVSAVIGVFLISTIIAFAVKAADNKISSTTGLISEVSVTEEGKVPNFSNVTYKVNYKVGDNADRNNIVDEVTIGLTLKSSKDKKDYKFIEWNNPNFEEISTNIIGENKIEITAYNVPFGEHSQNFSLAVLNAELDSKIEIESVTLKAGSNGNVVTLNENLPSTLTTYTEKIEILTVIAKPGIATKNLDAPGRNAKFGLLLGFYSDYNTNDLKGKYISPTVQISMSASEVTGGVTKFLNISNKEEDFGVYDTDIYKNHYFNDLPVLASSGRITSLAAAEINEEEENPSYNSAPSLILADNDSLTFEKHPSGNNDTEIKKKLMIEGKEVVCNNTSKCAFSSNADLNVNGTYNASYRVTDLSGKNSTTLKQKIVVVDPQDKTGLYALKGAKTTYITDRNNFTDLGLDKIKTDNSLYTGHITSVFYYPKEDSSIKSRTLTGADLSPSNEYIQEYVINNPAAEDPSIPVTTIKRNIVVINKSITSDQLKASQKSTTGLLNEYKENGLYLNEEKIDCTSANACSTNAKDVLTSEGEHEVTYTISNDKNDVVVTKIVKVEQNYYALNIEGLGISNALEKMMINNKTFFAIGSYYVTVPTESEESTINFSAFASGQEEISSVTLENKKVSNGTNSLTNDLYVNEDVRLVKVDSNDKNGLNGNYYTAAMGEKVIVDTKFSYGADADNSIKDLSLMLEVNENLLPTSYSEDVITSSEYYGINLSKFGEALSDEINSEIKYCTDVNTCNINPEEYDVSKQNVKYIKILIKNNIMPGTEVNVKTAYIVKTYTDKEDLSNTSINNKAIVTFGTIKLEESSLSAYVTPYKLRSSIFAGLNDNLSAGEIFLDVSKNNNYTMYATTNITAPAMMLNTNIFGYNNITNVPVTFTLPRGVNYVYNPNYIMQPTVKRNGDGTTTISYNYRGAEPNGYMEPIYFDFNVDVATNHGTELIIEEKIGNHSWLGITNDLSSASKYKTNYLKINVQNTEKVSYGQYTYSEDNKQMISNISKDGKFIFKTKLYNTNENNVTNVNVYTLLPNLELNKSKFSGNYDITTMPSNAYCTNDLPSVVSASLNSVKWKPCQEFLSNGIYKGVTAYRVSYQTLVSGTSSESSITIKTSKNNPGDTYVFESFFNYDGSESQKINFKDLSIDVISKRISGIVWEDFNLDGLMEDDEKRIETVTLGLFKEGSNELVQTTTPNKKGVYTFSGLEEGNYYVVAEFNTDKYGVTASVSDYNDLSKVSVFKSEVIKEELDITAEGNDELDNDGSDDENEDEAEEPEESPVITLVKTDVINITVDTREVKHVNLGLTLKKKFGVKVNKYITRAEVTNALGVVTKKDYGNTKLAKLDVKDINNLKIKVVYTIEIENIKYYPGYVKLVTEQIPDGMSFNKDYEENKGWTLNDDGLLTNNTLENDLIEENGKRYLTIALDVTRKEAGSFINNVSVDELEILGGTADE